MLKDYENRKPYIETERLVLREYRREDVPALRNWLGSEEIYKFWGRGPLDIELDPQLLFDGPGWPRGAGVIPDIRLVIVPKDGDFSGQAVGEIQLYDCMDFRIGEIGYRISSQCRGRGYATEALTAMANWVFEETELDRLNAMAAMENPASCKVLEKAGFVHEGTVRHGCMINYYGDYGIFGMLRSDWAGK